MERCNQPATVSPSGAPSGQPAFVCAQCGRRYTRKASLTKHVHLHHNTASQTDHRCDICGRQFADSDTIEQHRKAVHCVTSGSGLRPRSGSEDLDALLKTGMSHAGCAGSPGPAADIEAATLRAESIMMAVHDGAMLSNTTSGSTNSFPVNLSHFQGAVTQTSQESHPVSGAEVFLGGTSSSSVSLVSQAAPSMSTCGGDVQRIYLCSSSETGSAERGVAQDVIYLVAANSPVLGATSGAAGLVYYSSPDGLIGLHPATSTNQMMSEPSAGAVEGGLAVAVTAGGSLLMQSPPTASIPPDLARFSPLSLAAAAPPPDWNKLLALGADGAAAAGPGGSGDSASGKTPAAFQCEICARLFDTEKYLSMHMALHSSSAAAGGQLSVTADGQVMPAALPPPIRRPKTGNNPTGTWTCPMCLKTFAINSNYKNHLRTHSGDRPFVCEKCCIGFKERYHLKKHELFKHTADLKEQCRFCAKKFKDSTAVRAHERTHSDVRPYGCDKCNKTFKTSECLWHHENRSKTCGKALSGETGPAKRPPGRAPRQRKPRQQQQQAPPVTSSQLDATRFATKVETSSSSQQIHKTQMYSFHSSGGNGAHSSSLHSIDPSQESHLTPAFQQHHAAAYSLGPHASLWNWQRSAGTVLLGDALSGMEIPDGISVVKVEATDHELLEMLDYSSLSALNVSSDSMASSFDATFGMAVEDEGMEEDDEDEEEDEEGAVREDATYCHRVGDGESEALRQYQVSCGGEPRRVRARPRAVPEGDVEAGARPYRCDVCEAGFKLKVHLKKHKLYKHSNAYPCTCRVCGKAFKDSSAVRLHERIHSTDRPFQCQICGKSFKTRENLWGHRHRGPCEKSTSGPVSGTSGYQEAAPPGQLDGDCLLQAATAHLSQAPPTYNPQHHQHQQQPRQLADGAAFTASYSTGGTVDIASIEQLLRSGPGLPFSVASRNTASSHLLLGAGRSVLAVQSVPTAVVTPMKREMGDATAASPGPASKTGTAPASSFHGMPPSLPPFETLMSSHRQPDVVLQAGTAGSVSAVSENSPGAQQMLSRFVSGDRHSATPLPGIDQLLNSQSATATDAGKFQFHAESGYLAKVGVSQSVACSAENQAGLLLSHPQMWHPASKNSTQFQMIPQILNNNPTKANVRLIPAKPPPPYPGRSSMPTDVTGIFGSYHTYPNSPRGMAASNGKEISPGVMVSSRSTPGQNLSVAPR